MRRALVMMIFGALVLMLPPAASAHDRDVRCGNAISDDPEFEPQVIRGGSVGDVFVPRGTWCVLAGADVRGNVTVSRDAILIAGDDDEAGDAPGTIRGNLTCLRCEFTGVIEKTTIRGSYSSVGATGGFVLCDSAVRGHVSVLGANGFVDLGGSADEEAECGGNTIGGDLTVAGNHVGGSELDTIRIQDNAVRGSVRLLLNRGPSAVIGNTIKGRLDCNGNQPPPTGGGNRAAVKQGQCRRL